MAESSVLVLATRNAKKAQELKQLLASDRWQIKSLNEFSALPEVEEDGDTFEANAIKKAVTLSQHVPFGVVADDSGLEVEVLQGAPGIYSARYASETGSNATDEANCKKLLDVMKAETNRKAQFRCALAVANAGHLLLTVEGVCEGEILVEPKGQLGFGYDPLFVPVGYDKSFAELSSEIKNRVSHRAHAINQLKKWLEGSIL